MGCGNNNNTHLSYGGNPEGGNPTNDLQPGFYPDGVPQPNWIDCVKVDKVYESAYKSKVNEDRIGVEANLAAETDYGTDVEGFLTDGAPEILDVECVSVELITDPVPVCKKIPSTNRVKTRFQYRYTVNITFEYTDNDNEERVTASITKTFESNTQTFTCIMARTKEPGLDVQCEIFLDCLEALPDPDPEPFDPNGEEIEGLGIITCILKLIVFKLYAHVQLLIPAYGFCPLPDECPEVIGECPDVPVPPWPPYPPQS